MRRSDLRSLNDPEVLEDVEFICPACGSESSTTKGIGCHIGRVHPERSIELRIEVFTEKAGDDDCWHWRSCHFANGYAMLRHESRPYPTIRAVLGLERGNPLFALHSCDEKWCVNPHHLRAGTHRENVRDALERSRYERGEDRYSAKMTEASVRSVRRRLREGERVVDLARHFEVSESLIYLIKNRRAWAWLND